MTHAALQDLLPCPFCGKSCAVLSNTREMERPSVCFMYAVFCDATADGCGATGGYHDESTDAIAAWNRRASLKGEAEPVGDVRDYGPVLYCQLPPGTKLYTTPPPQQAAEWPQSGDAVWQGIDKMLVAAYEHGLNSEPMDMIAMKARYAALATNPTPSPAPQGGGEALSVDAIRRSIEDAMLTGTGVLRIEHVPIASVSFATPPAQQPGEVGEEIVGHKTFSDGAGGFRHEPLTRAEADVLIAHCKSEDERRKALMPDERSAIRMMMDAHTRLTDMGWKDAIYCPKDGTTFEVIEPGSTGIHKCVYWGDWPNGGWWVMADSDMCPSRPVLFRALAPKENK